MQPEPLYWVAMTLPEFPIGGVWYREVRVTWIVAKREGPLDWRRYATRKVPTEDQQNAREALNECFRSEDVQQFRELVAERIGEVDLQVKEIPADEVALMANGEARPLTQFPQGGLRVLWDNHGLADWLLAIADAAGCEIAESGQPEQPGSPEIISLG